MSSALALEVRGIVKRYGATTALDSLSLDVPVGDFLGLLGPNGAGKSTLISLVSGYRRADGGILRLFGQPVEEHAPDHRARLGLVPQSIALYTDLSAEANLRLFGRLAGVPARAIGERVEAALQAVQLTDRRREPVRTFSGGMQRRLNIAVALLHQPQLLLCDEPTVGVDPQSRNAIFDLLQGLHASGMTIVYSTHYMEEAEKLCRHIAIIDRGRVLAQGTLEELLHLLLFEEAVHLGREAGNAATRLGEFGTIELTPAGHRLRLRPEVRLSRVFARLEELGVPARCIEVTRPTLEDVFLNLTGRSLRE